MLFQNCFNYLLDPEWSIDADGFHEECSWCGNGGNLCMCDTCQKAICKGCVRRNFDRREATEILEAPVWICFNCEPKPLRPLQETADAIFWQFYHSYKKQKQPRSKKEGTKRKASGGDGDDAVSVSSSKSGQSTKATTPKRPRLEPLQTPVFQRVISDNGSPRVIVVQPQDVFNGATASGPGYAASMDGSEASTRPSSSVAKTSKKKKTDTASDKKKKLPEGGPKEKTQSKLPVIASSVDLENDKPPKLIDMLRALKMANSGYTEYLAALEREVSSVIADDQKPHIQLISEMETCADDLCQVIRKHMSSLNSAVARLSKGITVDLKRKRFASLLPPGSKANPSPTKKLHPSIAGSASRPPNPPAPKLKPSTPSTSSKVSVIDLSDDEGASKQSGK